METAEADTTEQAYLASGMSVRQQHNGDERLAVLFYDGTRHNPAKSAAEGRPVYDSVVFVRIQVPGDKSTVVEQVVSDDPSVTENPGHQLNYRLRFPKQWAAFKAKQQQETSTGTPLKAWPAIARNQVEEMKAFGVHTVEQLATMADVNAQKFPGAQQLKQAAQDWLARAKDSSFTTQLRSELDKRDSDIAALKAQIDALTKAQAEKPKERR